MSGLNLPWYSKSEGSRSRVIAARRRAQKVAADILASIPEVPDPAELADAVNGMLSSGTIKTMDDASDLAGTPKPSPTQAEAEAAVNRSGYALVNKKLVMKLDPDSSNVEALRMLYMAGMSIDDIRSVLSSLMPGSSYVVPVAYRVVKTTLSIQELHEKFRFYPEYYVSTTKGTYLVLDRIADGLSKYAIVCEQSGADNASLYLKPTFPVTGTLSYVYDGEEGSVDLNLQSGDDVAVQMADLPFSAIYDRTLNISSSKPLYFKRSDAAVKLGLVSALQDAYKVMSSGYSGYYDNQEGDYPFNVAMKAPSVSTGNSRKIYSSLVSQGFPEDRAFTYISGEPLNNGLDEAYQVGSECPDDSLGDRVDNIFKIANYRMESIDRDSIEFLCSLDDADLEYLLGQRTDITGIDPSVSKEECLQALEMKFSSNASITLDGDIPSDIWKPNTSTSRMAVVLKYEVDDSEEGTVLKESIGMLRDFLDAANAVFDYSADLGSASTTYSETHLGMDFACSADCRAVYSFRSGLVCAANARADIGMPDWYQDFLDDCKVIEAYLNAAMETFNSLMTKLAALIQTLNSCISVVSGSSTAGLGVGSILECSVSLSASIVLPPFLSLINFGIKAVLDVLASFVAGIRALVDKMLCPVQALIDKYINTNKFVLPCKISYNVPVISGISGYLGGYISALRGLSLMCTQAQKDGDWLKFKASGLPGSVSLMITKSSDCKESD